MLGLRGYVTILGQKFKITVLLFQEGAEVQALETWIDQVHSLLLSYIPNPAYAVERHRIDIFFSFFLFKQMARVVGGALLVRMFLHMFLIPILVSAVSLFTYTGVLFIPTLYLSDLQGLLQK